MPCARRLIPGQFKSIAGMLIPEGEKLGVTLPAGGHCGNQSSDAYGGVMEL